MKQRIERVSARRCAVSVNPTSGYVTFRVQIGPDEFYAPDVSQAQLDQPNYLALATEIGHDACKLAESN